MTELVARLLVCSVIVHRVMAVIVAVNVFRADLYLMTFAQRTEPVCL